MTQTFEKLSGSIADIETLLAGGFAYIDKTPLLRRLVRLYPFSLLLRPSGFGKTLTLSVLHKTLTDSGYAVVSVDLACPVSRLSDNLLRRELLSDPYAGLDTLSAAELLDRSIRNLHKSSEKGVAVLIDNYDSSTDTGTETWRECIENIFETLLQNRQQLRCVCVTGIFPPAVYGLESPGRLLYDISKMPRYNSICGFTAEELTQAIPQTSAKTDMERLKRHCGGYRFSVNGEELLNPSLAASYLDFDGDIPIEMIPPLPAAVKQAIIDSAADSRPLLSPRHEPAESLYHTGFLTLSPLSRSIAEPVYISPNRMMERRLFSEMLPSHPHAATTPCDIELMRQALINGDIDSFLSRAKALISSIPSTLSVNRQHEAHYHTFIYLLTCMLGFPARCEVATSMGRIDMLLTTEKYIYIFEFKIRQSPQTAMTQIEERHYADPFVADNRKIIKVAVNFSDTTRTIDSWIISETP